MTSDPLSLFADVKAAQARGDVAAMKALYAVDATMYEPYMTGTVSGPDVAVRMGSALGTDFSAVEYDLIGSIVSGERAAVEIDERVTLLDGKVVHLRNCTIVECRDGLIVRWYEYLQPHKRRS
ncbi:MAG: nuclear transport factor 2 family protein [Nocardioidaceae bacterium]|nr:MAG: nuclear transport factor 2 family protein [Nocardioidaceae bacterium]